MILVFGNLTVVKNNCLDWLHIFGGISLLGVSVTGGVIYVDLLNIS